MDSNTNVNSKRNKIIIVVLSILLLVTVSVTIWALFFRNTEVELAPDYAPQNSEEYAEVIDDDDQKLPQENGGGAVSLSYSKDIVIDLSEKKASLSFTNPNKSNQNIMLQIVVKDTVVVQSGLILPSHKVTTLGLLDSAKLSEGEYEGKIVVLYYQADTGEKAMLNTEIPLTIKVKE